MTRVSCILHDFSDFLVVTGAGKPTPRGMGLMDVVDLVDLVDTNLNALCHALLCEDILFGDATLRDGACRSIERGKGAYRASGQAGQRATFLDLCLCHRHMLRWTVSGVQVGPGPFFHRSYLWLCSRLFTCLAGTFSTFSALFGRHMCHMCHMRRPDPTLP